ncbi:hypothetical protein NESM_000104700 [Novymonas esmeraldas]|uniref:Nuclear pore complex protein n=1 Tax=Novymonas esmeraldas TaxID=1808958 RepID=A0AAW0F4C6_9TRYP
MSLRIVSRRLALPAVHGRAPLSAAASPSSLTGEPRPAAAPLLQFPPFQPVAFEQDKFLSIKSRSLETYAKVRSDVLQRCIELRGQLQRRQEQTELGGTTEAEPLLASSAHSGTAVDLPALPLTPHQAEELLLLTKKVEDLVQFQGFLLTDEFVWRMLHLCIECGAAQLAVEGWLEKHVLAEKRGPPFPLFIVEDLAALLRTSVLPRLPESGAGLVCSSTVMATCATSTAAMPASGARVALSVALEDGLGAAQRCLHRHLHGSDESSDTPAAVAAHAGSHYAARAYTSHLLAEHVWPVWRALQAMDLTFARPKLDELEEDDDAAGADEATRAGTAEWLPDAAAQTLAVRTALMSVTPLYSFHSHASAAAGATTAGAQTPLSCDPPLFADEAAAMVAPLRALLDAWLVLAQCAAEAKEVALLKALLHTVCRGFLTVPAAATADDAAEQVSVRVNEEAWCRYALAPDAETAEAAAHRDRAERQARAMVHEFVDGSLSLLHYGLLCAEQETALWRLHDTSALVSGAARLLRGAGGGEGERRGWRLRRHCRSARLDRMAAVQLGQSDGERGSLLCDALPRALVAAVTPQEPDEETDDHAHAAAAAHRFLRDALSQGAVAAVTSAEGPAEAPAYAEAGRYVGLATGDEALLTHAAAAATSDAPAADTAEKALLLLNARALQSYRHAASSLRGAGETRAAEEEDRWEAWTAAVEQRGASRSVDTTPGHFIESCLQALVLRVAEQQLQCAAAYVHAVQQHTTPSSAAEETEQEDEEGRGDGGSFHDDETSGASCTNGADEEEQQQTMELAWAKLQEGTAACTGEMLARVEQLLAALPTSAPAEGCLSPSSLATLAVLLRLGVYAEGEEGAAAASASAGDELADISATSPFSARLDRVLGRVVDDTCANLRRTSVATTSVVGNWVQWVLLTLMARQAWADVLVVLRALDGDAATDHADAGAPNSLLSSTTVDPSVFAALYARAVEDGAASVCAFLRPRRERLFF